MADKTVPQCPLILRAHRLMDAFSKSDDERDFYLDRSEGFIIFVDLNKQQTDLDILEEELLKNPSRFCLLPKLTFYETKKIMEGFVNEKVYDIDTKEKLLDIIQSKEARDNFLEFIYDHHSEQEKWQQYYQERSRIRIIEWLRQNQFQFVFEEDLELPKQIVEKVKMSIFDTKVSKEISSARDTLQSKAKTYYSTEALNPRPKRGRPPKQAAKVEIEPQMTGDLYSTVPATMRPFLFIPDITSAAAVTFSSKYESEEEFLASLRQGPRPGVASQWDSLSQKLASLRTLARGAGVVTSPTDKKSGAIDWSQDDDDESEEVLEDEELKSKSAKKPVKVVSKKSTPIKEPSPKKKK